MEYVLYIRLLKLLAVAVYVTGALGVTIASEKKTQRRFAFALAGPGFGLTWLVGFFLIALRHERVMATWVMGSMAASLVTINVVIYLAAGSEDRRGALSIGLIAVTLLSTFALMVFRPG